MYVPVTVTNSIQCNKCVINSIFFITTIFPDNFCIFIVFSNVYIRQCDTWILIKNLYNPPARQPSHMFWKVYKVPIFKFCYQNGSHFLILLSKTARELASLISLEIQIFSSFPFIKLTLNRWWLPYKLMLALAYRCTDVHRTVHKNIIVPSPHFPPTVLDFCGSRTFVWNVKLLRLLLPSGNFLEKSWPKNFWEYSHENIWSHSLDNSPSKGYFLRAFLQFLKKLSKHYLQFPTFLTLSY